MGRKGKRRKESDDSLDNGHVGKREKWGNSPGGVEIPVSQVLSEVSTTLYGQRGDIDISGLLSDLFENSEKSEPESKSLSAERSDMEDSANVNKSPTLADIMQGLTSVHKRLGQIDGRLDDQGKKLDDVQKTVGGFEQELKKLWSYIHENEKKMGERMNKVEESMEAADFNLTMLNDKVHELEKSREELSEQVVYMQSQSMRNNLVFSNIPEVQNGGSEDTEKTIRVFIKEKMKIAQNIVDELKFDRVHRMGQRREGRARHIVARFTLFKERELVRRQSATLKGTGHFVFEQFPREVNERRKKLLPRLKEEQKKGNRAWLSYDTLYVNGKAVKDSR